MTLTIASFAIATVIATRYASEVAAALDRIRRIRLGRLLIAVVLEAASVLLAGAMQRHIVRRAGASVSRARAAAVATAGSAIALSVPGGPFIAGGYMYQQYRRQGLDRVLVGWVVATMTTISIIALTAFSIIGARGASGINRTSIVTTVLVTALLVGAILVVTAPRRLDRVALAMLRLIGRFRRLTVDPQQAWKSFVERLTAVDVRGRDWVVLFTYSFGNWATDCGSLYLAARALNAHLGFTGVVVAYAVGQAILAFPLTPGGIGIYEAGVTAALTRVGIRRSKALSSVMMYRFISLWGMLLVGWLCWTLLHVIDRRADRRQQTSIP
ncbi:MAG: rane protein [Ilumatobacteraceae bacterium]|nr:rane protein [Ilumatobacteraceae bacterium]